MQNLASVFDQSNALSLIRGKCSHTKSRGTAGWLRNPCTKGRISGLLNFLLVYFSFLWKKELHVAAGDLSGTKDIT